MKKSVVIIYILLGAFAGLSFASTKAPQYRGRSIKIALLLPFCSSMPEAELKRKKLALVQKAALEYYEGILTALDSLEKLGFECTLTVYDTQKDSITTLRILQKPEIKNMDFIVGPLFKEGINMLAGYCLQNKIYHLSPVVSVGSSVTTPYLINTNTDISNFDKGITDFWVRDFDTANIYIIHDGKKSMKALAEKLRSKPDSINMLKVKILNAVPYLKTEDIITSPEKPALLLMLSNDENWVNRQMKNVKDLENFTLMGLESWLDFKTPDFEKWIDYHCLFATTHHVNILNAKGFRELFRAKYYTEPGEYSYKGFDQMLYIGKLYNTYGANWTDHLDETYEALHNNFGLDQDPITKQWINTEIKILKLEGNGLMQVYR